MLLEWLYNHNHSMEHQNKFKRMIKMKTTHKHFRTQIGVHIIDHLSTDETTNLDQQLQNVIDEFHNWYSSFEQKRTPNRQQAFVEYLKCLPSCLSVEYTYYNIHETLKQWYTNCGMEYKYSEPNEKESDYYWKLVHREFKRMCKERGLKGGLLF